MGMGILWLVPNERDEALIRDFSLPKGFMPARHIHVTLLFGIEKEGKEDLLGQEVEVITGPICSNESVIAMRVELPMDVEHKPNPHITLGHLPDVLPQESNSMLLGQYTKWVPKPISMVMRYEFLEFS